MSQEDRVQGMIESIDYVIVGDHPPSIIASFPRRVTVSGKVPSFKVGDAVEAAVSDDVARSITVTAQAKYPLMNLGGDPPDARTIDGTIVQIGLNLRDPASDARRRIIADKTTRLPSLGPGDKVRVTVTSANEIVTLTAG